MCHSHLLGVTCVYGLLPKTPTWWAFGHYLGPNVFSLNSLGIFLDVCLGTFGLPLPQQTRPYVVQGWGGVVLGGGPDQWSYTPDLRASL